MTESEVAFPLTVPPQVIIAVHGNEEVEITLAGLEQELAGTIGQANIDPIQNTVA